jgi:hypothetical protein
MAERSHMRFVVPGRCSRAVPRVLAISFGRLSMYSRLDGSAAAAARGLLWPVGASTCHLGAPPPSRGLYTKASAPSTGVEGG